MMSPDEAIEILEELPERLISYDAEYIWQDERVTEALMIAVECLKEKCHE
jgi:hypothetical protein